MDVDKTMLDELTRDCKTPQDVEKLYSQMLQHMINRDFQNATVLTIAHRLATVLDSDRIMVLSEGSVVEFDSPRNLVKDKNGVFYELAREGGVLQTLLG